jgi:hypothetical protein
MRSGGIDMRSSGIDMRSSGIERLAVQPWPFSLAVQRRRDAAETPRVAESKNIWNCAANAV